MALNSVTTLSQPFNDKIFFQRELPSSRITPPLQATDTYQNSLENLASIAEQENKNIQNQLDQALKIPDAKTQEEISKINTHLQSQGKAPINYAKTEQDIEDIQKSTLSNKEKKKKIDELRKSLGLSKGEMKRLFTKRMAKLNADAAKTLKTRSEQRLGNMKNTLASVEKQFGPQSPQATQLKNQIQSIGSSDHSRIAPLEQRASFYKSLYPGFWSRLGGFFKKIGQGLLKGLHYLSPLLRFIPGIGQMASMAIRSIENIFQLIRDPKKYLTSIFFS